MNSTFHGACLYSWHNHLRGQKLWNLFTTKCSSIHCVHYNMKTVIIYMYVNLWFLRKTSLTPPLFIVEVHVPVSSQRWYLCLRGINFCVFLRFFLDFGTVLTVWYLIFLSYTATILSTFTMKTELQEKQNEYVEF